MPNENRTPDLAASAALVADPTRARMLTLLMDGRAQTATELALEGGVSASTASSHLSRLSEAGLVSVARQGRHRYFRLASAEVAGALEALMSLAPPRGGGPPRKGPRDQALRRARVCYDHLAGEAGVRLLAGLRRLELINGGDDAMALTAAGEAWCSRLGIDLAPLRARRRKLCRACLDWSERRMHLAGALGAALLDHLLQLRAFERVEGGRALLVSPRGEAFLEDLRGSG